MLPSLLEHLCSSCDTRALWPEKSGCWGQKRELSTEHGEGRENWKQRDASILTGRAVEGLPLVRPCAGTLGTNESQSLAPELPARGEVRPLFLCGLGYERGTELVQAPWPLTPYLTPQCHILRSHQGCGGDPGLA